MYETTICKSQNKQNYPDAKTSKCCQDFLYNWAGLQTHIFLLFSKRENERKLLHIKLQAQTYDLYIFD